MNSVWTKPQRLLRGKYVFRSAEHLRKLARTNVSFHSLTDTGLSSKSNHLQQSHLSLRLRNGSYVYKNCVEYPYMQSKLCSIDTSVARCNCQVPRHFSTSTRGFHESETNSTHQTYDKSEVDKFSKLSNDWWNEQGEFGALHSLNSLRVPLVRDSLMENTYERPSATEPLTGLKIVDVGCGGGILSEPLARLGADVLGVDASAENVAAAEAHAAADDRLADRLTYRCCLVEDLAADDGPIYDGVVASEILEHVADANTFVQSCCHLLKPGGSVFFTTMNRTMLAYTLAVVAAERIFRIVPSGAHDWNKFVTPEELTTMLEESDTEVRLVHGMCLNPVSLRWSWTTDTSINYSIHAVKGH